MSEITLEILQNEHDRLVKKLEAIKLMMEEYNSHNDKPFSYVLERSGRYKIVFDSIGQSHEPLDGFPIQETWLSQILYLLEDRNRFMSNHELAESLTVYHYGFNVDKMKRKVSVVISAAYKANRVEGLIKVGTSKSAKDALWGFNKWLTKDKKIKEENFPFGRSSKQKYILQ